MCAAPGMKTTFMAATIRNKGIIYANDYSKDRYQLLCENVKKKNSKCVTTLNRDAMELSKIIMIIILITQKKTIFNFFLIYF